MKEGARIGEQYARRLIDVLAAVWLVVAICIGLLVCWTPALQGIVCVWLFLLLGVGFVGSAVTELGDLSFSLIKRQFGIKDYGALIPGHGGMLDRFDSMSFAAPTMWVLVTLLPAI